MANAAATIIQFFSFLVHTRDVVAGCISAYRDYHAPNALGSYLKLEMDFSNLLVELFKPHESQAQRSPLHIEQKRHEAVKKLLMDAEVQLKNNIHKINDLKEKDLASQHFSKSASTLSWAKHMFGRLLGQEGNTAKIERIFRENLCTTVQMSMLLDGGSYSIINHLTRDLVQQSGSSAGEDQIPQTQLQRILENSQFLQQLIEKVLQHHSSNAAQTMKLLHPSEVKSALLWRRGRRRENHISLEVSESFIVYDKRLAPPEQLRTAAEFQSSQGNGSNNIEGFLEWRKWKNDGLTDKPKTMLGEQVGALAYMLGTSDPLPDVSRIPACLGYFLDSRNDRYGMFFTFNDPRKGDSMATKSHKRPKPLECLLGDTGFPGLDRKWKISVIKTLLNAVHSLHSLEICHKAFSSKNVLFLGQQTYAPPRIEHGPYLAGMFQARLDDMYSDFATYGSTDLMYLPYTYLKDRSGEEGFSHQPYFHLKYDLFGLGVVCAEVATWNPMKALIQEKVKWSDPNPRREMERHWKTLQQGILSRCQEALGPVVSEVIEWCLKNGASEVGEVEDRRGHLDELNKHIKAIEHSEDCTAGVTSS